MKRMYLLTFLCSHFKPFSFKSSNKQSARIVKNVVIFHSRFIWPGRRAVILRRGIRRLRPCASSYFVLVAVLVSVEINSISPVDMASSSTEAKSSWFDWIAGSISVTLRRGSSGDLLIAGSNDGDFVVVFGWTCNRLRLRNLFKGFGMVVRACGKLVSIDA